MLTSHSPWDWSEVVWEGETTGPEQVAAAVSAAAAGFRDWSLRDAAERVAALKRLGEVLVDRNEALVDLLVREAGKTRADAEAEAGLLARKIDITLEVGLARTPGFDALSSEGPAVAWRPRGVAAVLGPFNFPLHLLHGLVVPAVAVGCTVVAKPSNHTPALGELYAECLAQAGLDEVVRIIQGGPPVGAALCKQAEVSTVAAVGGQAMGFALQRLLGERPEVVLALELGGVNQALVCDDAALEPTVAALAEGAWKMAGQRCTATRVVHVPRDRADDYVAALTAAAETWSDAESSGVLISPQARERFLGPWRELPRGLELVRGEVDAGEERCRTEPLLLRITDPAARDTVHYRQEHFGPMLIVDPYDAEASAVARMAANPYRLAASVFTPDRERFLALARRLPYGQVNHDRQTAGARSELPFGGCGLSGNGHPAAVAACEIFADETVVW